MVVEITAPLGWRKSSYSGTGDCVEVAVCGDDVLVRDTKDPAGARLTFTVSEWRAFLDGVAAGEFTVDSLRRYRMHSHRGR